MGPEQMPCPLQGRFVVQYPDFPHGKAPHIPGDHRSDFDHVGRITANLANNTGEAITTQDGTAIVAVKKI